MGNSMIPVVILIHFDVESTRFGSKRSWWVFLVSEVSLLAVFDNISQKKKYILQVANIQNLTPKHCSTEILLIIFSTQKMDQKKKHPLAPWSHHQVYCNFVLVPLMLSKALHDPQHFVGSPGYFLKKKSPQLQGRSLFISYLGIFFSRKTHHHLWKLTKLRETMKAL